MKLILFPNITLLILLTHSCFAQPTYKTDIKPDRDLNLLEAKPMENGDCLLSGYDDYSTPSTILRLTRINSYGKAIWSKHYHTPGYYSYTMCFTGTKDNGFIAVARLDSANKYGLALQIFKCDSSGNIQWQKKIVPDSKTGIFPSKIIQKKNGGYYLVYNEIQFTAIARFDTNGNLLWLKGFDATITDYGYSVNTLSESDDGGALIALSHVSCEFYCINFEIYKFDDTGSPETSLSFIPDYGFSANVCYLNEEDDGTFKMLFRGAILRAPEKYSYLAIRPNSSKADVLNFSADILSLQYLIRTGKIPDGRRMLAASNRFYERNRYFNADLSLSISSNYYYGNNQNYIHTEKHDSLGRICPDYGLPAIDSTINKTKVDLYRGVFSLTNSSGFSINNSTIYSADVDDIIVHCSGKAPRVMPYIAADPGNSVQNKNTFTIHPNPVHDFIQISKTGDGSSSVTIEIMGMDGSLHHRSYFRISRHTVHKINTSDLPKGIYSLKIKTNKGQQILKFLKD